ncbi:MAG: thiamine phosphate synthase [Rhodospirillales bacterium]|nr:thiamine phosphate synthase [Rhodospirillales bacterium]
MDSRLIAWGRVVKRRRAGLPPLWFFTDEHRTPDPLPIIKRLPVGLCGVVFRHDSHPDRARLARKVARLCRARRLLLIIAGDARLAAALGAGQHLRGGAPVRRTRRGLRSASAHDAAQLAKVRLAGVDLIFISPVFPTASHPGEPGLGVLGWLKLACQAGQAKPCGLGGITGQRARALPPRCAGAGAIEAFF